LPAGNELSAQKGAQQPSDYFHKSRAKTAVFASLAELLRRNISRKFANKKPVNSLKYVTIM
jgi:hypothetical protein